MLVLVVILVRVARDTVAGMPMVMMVMIVSMNAQVSLVASRVPMHLRRCPRCELERNDEHEDQDDEATHGVHSTELVVLIKKNHIWHYAPMA